MIQKVAIITGAGKGVGRATAVELDALGYAVVLVARSRADLEETAKLATTALVKPADVRDSAALKKVVAETLARFGRIDAIVNNAGLAPSLGVTEHTDEIWHDVIDVNLSGAFFLIRETWPTFVRQKSGVIVNISSSSARDPYPGFIAYAAAKAGMVAMGNAVAKQGEPHGITVHTIAPGGIETEMFRKLFTNEQYSPDKTLRPADVAKVVARCVAGDLRHSSGETIWLHKTV